MEYKFLMKWLMKLVRIWKFGHRIGRRDFIITASLQEGYELEGRLHTVDEAIAYIHEWQRNRLESEKIIVTGTVTMAHCVYSYQRDGEVIHKSEPTILFAGDTHPSRHAESDDEKIENVLLDLAHHLASRLNQTRVYVSWCDKTLVLEQTGGGLP